jgi:hypothetical protein
VTFIARLDLGDRAIALGLATALAAFFTAGAAFVKVLS